MALSTVAAFLIYLFIPDAGLGGNEAKIRFSWSVFVLGGLLLATSRRLRPFRVPFDLYATVLLLATLASTQGKVWKYSESVDDYLRATRQIPEGSRVVRLGYQTPDIPRLYDYEDIGRNPLFHADSYVAAQCRCLDLSDYQAPNNIFPVVFNKKVSIGARYGLWSFELPRDDAGTTLKWLETELPVSIDYVILVADESTPEIHGPGYGAVTALLNREMHQIGTSSNRTFVRVYERNR